MDQEFIDVYSIENSMITFIVLFVLTSLFVILCIHYVVSYRTYNEIQLDDDAYEKIYDGICAYQDCIYPIGLNAKFCNAHTLQLENVFVAKSNIPGAGYGLFAGPKGFKNGEIITKYGSYENEISYQEVLEMPNTTYVLCDKKNKCWNGENKMYSVGRYCNDCHKTVYACNSEFEFINGKAYILATNDIPPYHEIFTNYGSMYWN